MRRTRKGQGGTNMAQEDTAGKGTGTDVEEYAEEGGNGRANGSAVPQTRPLASNKDDTFPIQGIDYVELYVGNAKQAAHFYRTAFGFNITAYAGPETKVRDRASYVLEQG